MSDQKDQQNNENVDLDTFAEMVGFPSELIKKELFDSNIDQNNVTMDQLRTAMLKYLDSTMISN